MTTLQFSEEAFLKVAAKEEDFTNLGGGGFERGADSFLKSFYADALQNEFLDYSLDDLILLARDFWMQGNRRNPGESIVTVKTSPTPSGSAKPDTAIQIITDDMSFLVDSLVSAVSSFGVTVSGLFHPIVEGWRDAEGHSGNGVDWVQLDLLRRDPWQTASDAVACDRDLCGSGGLYALGSDHALERGLCDDAMAAVRVDWVAALDRSDDARSAQSR